MWIEVPVPKRYGYGQYIIGDPGSLPALLEKLPISLLYNLCSILSVSRHYESRSLPLNSIPNYVNNPCELYLYSDFSGSQDLHIFCPYPFKNISTGKLGNLTHDYILV